MKSVLISIQPKWCELIASGKKTIEVRKTRPKLQTPFKCYIYCTKGKEHLVDILKDGDENYGEIYHGNPVFIKIDDGSMLDMYGKRQKVIGEFVCDSIDTIAVYNEQIYAVEHFQKDILQQSCLTLEEVKAYLGSKNRGYAWHISDLKIYDTPKELGEFRQVCREYGSENCCCDGCKFLINYRGYEYDESDCAYDGLKPLTRPPQSWQYIEENS